jgi:hypothetical protein
MIIVTASREAHDLPLNHCGLDPVLVKCRAHEPSTPYPTIARGWLRRGSQRGQRVSHLHDVTRLFFLMDLTIKEDLRIDVAPYNLPSCHLSYYRKTTITTTTTMETMVMTMPSAIHAHTMSEVCDVAMGILGVNRCRSPALVA